MQYFKDTIKKRLKKIILPWNGITIFFIVNWNQILKKYILVYILQIDENNIWIFTYLHFFPYSEINWK